MSYILNLDVGVSSIGVCLTKKEDIGDIELLNTIYLYQDDFAKKYKEGKKTNTPNQERRKHRSQRKLIKNKKKKLKKTKGILNGIFNIKLSHSDDNTVFISYLSEIVRSVKSLKIKGYNIFSINYLIQNRYIYRKVSKTHILKIRGQKERISLDQLCHLIYLYAKYNGYNELDGLKENEDSDYKQQANSIKEWCFKNNKTISYFLLENYYNQHRKDTPPILNELHKDELKKIWLKQSEFYPQLLTKDNFNKILKTIFYRKPQDSIRKLKNHCLFEEKSLVTPRSNPYFQEFRTRKCINDLIIYDKSYNKYLISNKTKEDIFNLSLNNNKITSNKIIRICLENGEISGNKEEFNTNYSDIPGNTVYKKLKELNIEEDNIYNVWHDIYSKNSLKNYNNVHKLRNIDFEISNSSYSEKAIKKLLPYMNGEIDYLNEYDAIQKVYPNKRINQEIYRFTQNQITNPIVRKVCNNVLHLLDHYQNKYDIGEINIEYARELKKSEKERERINKNNKDNNDINNHIKKTLEKYFPYVNCEDIKKQRKLKLWLEQANIDVNNKRTFQKQLNLKNGDYIDISHLKSYCPYSKKTIPYNKLFTNEIEIEHIIPQSRFFDNSFNNIALSFNDINRKKDRLTGFEFICDDYNRKSIIQHINNIYNNNEKKLNNFFYADDNYKNYEDFISFEKKNDFGANALNDTSYINKLIKKTIENKFENIKVNSVSSGAVNFIKYLNFSNQNDETIKFNQSFYNVAFNGYKDNKRNDNRNHAFDAFLVGIAKNYIQKINEYNSLQNINPSNRIKKDIKKNLMNNDPDHYINYYLTGKIEECLVHIPRPKLPVFYKKGKKGLRGSLRDETLYGIRNIKGENVPTVRKEKNEFIDKILSNIGNNEKLKKIIEHDYIINSNIKEKINYLINNHNCYEESLREELNNIIPGNYVRKIEADNLRNYRSDKIINKLKTAYIKPNNNHFLSCEIKNNKVVSNKVSLHDYVNGNYRNRDFRIHKGDYFILGYDNQDIKRIKKKTILENLYYVFKIDENVHLVPHYIPNPNSLSEDKKENIVKKSPNKLMKDYEKITKVYLNMFNEIIAL